jgi:arsenate reductase (thioredoxin)
MTLGTPNPPQVVAVCGDAHESCPMFRNDEPYTKTKVTSNLFEDPPALIDGLDDEEARLDVFRRVRDEIEAWTRTLPDTLPTLPHR